MHPSLADAATRRRIRPDDVCQTLQAVHRKIAGFGPPLAPQDCGICLRCQPDHRRPAHVRRGAARRQVSQQLTIRRSERSEARQLASLLDA
jgi:hypothetical protein